MPAQIGRTGLLIKKGAVVIAGVTAKTVSLAASPVDIGSDDSLGFRELLGVAGENTLDISVEGVESDAILSEIAFAAAAPLLTDISIVDEATGDTITGDFFMASYEKTGNYKDKITFTASFQSSGPWVATATP